MLLQTTRPLSAPADVTAVTRFQQVDAKLYRGGQPDVEGLRQLRTLGIEMVINLRSEQDALTQ